MIFTRTSKEKRTEKEARKFLRHLGVRPLDSLWMKAWAIARKEADAHVMRNSFIGPCDLAQVYMLLLVQYVNNDHPFKYLLNPRTIHGEVIARELGMTPLLPAPAAPPVVVKAVAREQEMPLFIEDKS